MSNNLNRNAMENQPTIQERLNAIVYLEIKELKEVLDKWFNEDKDRTSLDFGKDVNKLPEINLYNEWNYALNYDVKRIGVAHEGYYLVLNRSDMKTCEENNTIQYLDQDRWAFIPGELSKLTEFVKKWTNPAEPLYHFSDKQKEAIEQFKAAMEAISKQNVALLVDVENKQFVFANCNGLGEAFFDGSDGYMQTGYCTHVADIDTDRLPRTEAQYDTDFMDSDGIELVKEK